MPVPRNLDPATLNWVAHEFESKAQELRMSISEVARHKSNDTVVRVTAAADHYASLAQQMTTIAQTVMWQREEEKKHH